MEQRPHTNRRWRCAQSRGGGLAMGISLGVALGAMCNNLALGIAMGAAIGVVLDEAVARRNRRGE